MTKSRNTNKHYCSEKKKKATIICVNADLGLLVSGWQQTDCGACSQSSVYSYYFILFVCDGNVLPVAVTLVAVVRKAIAQMHNRKEDCQF